MSLKRAARDAVYKLVIDPILWLSPRVNTSHLRADSVYKIISDRAAQRAADYVEKHLDVALMFSARELLWDFAISKAPRDGLYLEFGVMTAASTNHFARRVARGNIKVYGFDSFEGLKEDWPGTEAPAGAYQVSKPTELEPNVELVVGWFGATLPGFLDRQKGPCSFPHIDCDTYPSTCWPTASAPVPSSCSTITSPSPTRRTASSRRSGNSSRRAASNTGIWPSPTSSRPCRSCKVFRARSNAQHQPHAEERSAKARLEAWARAPRLFPTLRDAALCAAPQAEVDWPQRIFT